MLLAFWILNKNLLDITQLLWGQLEEGKTAYEQAVQKGGRASECIQCGQCESACPQQIDVIARLAECAQQFDR